MKRLTDLPFDLKGTLSSNTIAAEQQTPVRVTNRTNRVLTPKYGAFFADTLVVRTTNGSPLVRDKDYVITYYYDDLMELTAREVAAMVVVTNVTVPSDIRLSYQAIGGPYSLNLDELRELLDLLEDPPEKIDWSDIKDKPLQFNPSAHLHEYWQLYGLDTTDICLDLLGQSWRYGNEPVVRVNREASDAMRAEAERTSQAYYNAVQSHIKDYQNPHGTTTVQLGLNNLSNFRLANVPESTSQTINNLYQPIGGVYNQTIAYAQPPLTQHIARIDNPHRLTINSPGIEAYTYQETVTLYSGKLRLGEVAVGTAALENRPEPAMTASIRSNLGAGNILAGTTFTMDQIMPGGGYWPPRNIPTDYIVMGTGYANIQALFAEYSLPKKEKPPEASEAASFISDNTTGIKGTSLRTFIANGETTHSVFQDVNGQIVQLL